MQNNQTKTIKAMELTQEQYKLYSLKQYAKFEPGELVFFNEKNDKPITVGYQSDSGITEIEGFKAQTVITDTGKPNILENDKLPSHNDVKQATIMVAGTNILNPFDWITDAGLAVGVGSNQGEDSYNYVISQLEKYPNAKFDITGHSKGSSNVQEALIKIAERCPSLLNRINFVAIYDGPNVYNRVTDEKVKKILEQQKDKMFNFLDPLDIVSLGYDYTNPLKNLGHIYRGESKLGLNGLDRHLSLSGLKYDKNGKLIYDMVYENEQSTLINLEKKKEFTNYVHNHVSRDANIKNLDLMIDHFMMYKTLKDAIQIIDDIAENIIKKCTVVKEYTDDYEPKLILEIENIHNHLTRDEIYYQISYHTVNLRLKNFYLNKNIFETTKIFYNSSSDIIEKISKWRDESKEKLNNIINELNKFREFDQKHANVFNLNNLYNNWHKNIS